jgi:RNase P protein component
MSVWKWIINFKIKPASERNKIKRAIVHSIQERSRLVKWSGEYAPVIEWNASLID